ncbi:class I SAM-dependent methyltransferase [Planktothrix sp. FACHB-1355]|uniref:Class I SAM-dependent methyltransferase n=1 Tax=Aerosakkonema funiforme FACHB-1375 TaxID=2949571 RepID=A0A926VLQ0_9CYAN|nr:MULTISPECIES: class I SAM-dependent methyltransferase [Oscillatoriales]MBD2185568.1 class I SAM-dependent methyltransferase [Aerosakkonema funiforme FACHB-1375]MBD3561140.1 class I SAM-dependent methyltransferase [Planktothrix sp. FACHB-1355]
MKYLQSQITELICPRCKNESLDFNNDVICCQNCQQQYEINNKIPLLFWPEDIDAPSGNITNLVKAFYEENPFPNYNDLDSVGSLMQKAKEGIFAKVLDEQLPFGIKVLECGCGTGQLSIFLSIANRTVFGVDMCLNSLKLGQAFKEKYELQRVNFLQMNIFQPIFKPESFHVVISNGVLHHTHNPKLAFSSIAKLVKPGGYIIIGLYHKYGRIWTDVRRLIFNLTGDKFKFLDPRIVDVNLNERKRHTWFMDQYKNPNEYKHTIGEVMVWFAENGFSFVNSIPKSGLGKKFSPDEKLFVAQSPGNALERFLVESSMIFTNSKEGGFFIMIGKKEG